MSEISTAPAPTTTEAGLRQNAVGLAGTLFQSVAMMGPAVAVAFAFFPGIGVAGGSFPLAVVVALVGCVLLSLSIGQLALHLPSAGGFYTYVSHGLGRIPGFLTGWLTIPVYLLFIPANLLVFGFVTEGFLQAEWGVDVAWWIWAIALALVMAVLTILDIRISTRTLVVLGAIEILVFALLSLFLIGHAPDGNTAQAFTPALSAEAGLGGWQGILQGAIFAFTAFVGFESAVGLGEESRNPRRIIPRAIFFSAVLIGLFYVLTGYAGVAGYGFNHLFPTSPTDTNAYLADQNPWGTLGGVVWGQAGLVIVTLVILNSTAANTGAGYTALARIVYALGRAGVLPRIFGTVHSRFRTPYVAILLAGVVSIGLAYWVTQVYGPIPANLTVILGVLTDCILVAYLGVSVSVFFYYRRTQSGAFRVLKHVVVPLITTLLLLGVLVAQFYPAPPPPANLAGPIAAGWLILGGIWAAVLAFRAPAALEAGKQIYETTE
jgi:amino acid transporter